MPSFRMLAYSTSLVLGVLSTPAMAQSRPEKEYFSPIAVVKGSGIDREQCDLLALNDTAIWVEAHGQSICMRYYAAGLKLSSETNPIVAIWLNGDVLGSHGNNADKRQSGFGPKEMVGLEERLFHRYGIPSIYLGRPGTYGSAGKHFDMRGRPIEAAFVNTALDGIKQRYHIQSLAVGGHSGGGTLVAEMLSRRNDLRCAVISSGASNYHAYAEAHKLNRPDRFDPFLSLDKIPSTPGRRIFVIGDPRETNVVFNAQKSYFDGLVAHAQIASLVPLEKATDAQHHDLVDFGEAALELCASGESTEDIGRTLKAMPPQAPRLTN